MFMDDRTVAQIAPSGDFGNTFSINCGRRARRRSTRRASATRCFPRSSARILCDAENLLDRRLTGTRRPPVDASRRARRRCSSIRPPACPIPRGFAQILRRNVEGGGRRDDLQHTNYRIVAGMRGELNDAWSYDMYYQFGADQLRRDLYRTTSRSPASTRALDVIDNPRHAGRRSDLPLGARRHRSDLRSLGHLRHRPGHPGRARLSADAGLPARHHPADAWPAPRSPAISAAGASSSRGRTTASASPSASSIARRSLELLTDAAFSTLPSSDLAGQGAPTLSVAGELRRPRGVRRGPHPDRRGQLLPQSRRSRPATATPITASAAAASAPTPTRSALDFSPIRDIRFRAAYNRAVRAPNIQELFAPQRVALNGNGDPCAGVGPRRPAVARGLPGAWASPPGSTARSRPTRPASITA